MGSWCVHWTSKETRARERERKRAEGRYKRTKTTMMTHEMFKIELTKRTLNGFPHLPLCNRTQSMIVENILSTYAMNGATVDVQMCYCLCDQVQHRATKDERRTWLCVVCRCSRIITTNRQQHHLKKSKSYRNSHSYLKNRSLSIIDLSLWANFPLAERLRDQNGSISIDSDSFFFNRGRPRWTRFYHSHTVNIYNFICCREIYSKHWWKLYSCHIMLNLSMLHVHTLTRCFCIGVDQKYCICEKLNCNTYSVYINRKENVTLVGVGQRI